MISLIHEKDRIALAAHIKAEIDEYCRVTYNDGHRAHLGASLIGDSCNRYLWYVFRWVQEADFDGRMQRLFNRGHQTEGRFIEWLKGIGFQVWEVDPSTGKQYRIYGAQGHFGGGLDGIVKTPAAYQIEEPFLLEMKTNKAGKTWAELVRRGVKAAKPKHFAQMSSYGAYWGFKYALYMAICKDDDDLYIEIVELDHNLGKELIERKAEHIISSQQPPPRISENPSFMQCKFCDKFKVCHQGDAYERNCRACQHAVPVNDAGWYCSHWNQPLPGKEAILTYAPKCPAFHEAGRKRATP